MGEAFMEMRLFGVCAPGKRKDELPALPDHLTYWRQVDPDASQQLYPEDAIELLTRGCNGDEEKSRVLFAMYSDCKREMNAANRVAAWEVDGAPTEEAMVAIRWAEVLSIVLISSFYWACYASDTTLAKAHMSVAIDGVAFKTRFFDSAHGQRLAKFAYDTFGIVAF